MAAELLGKAATLAFTVIVARELGSTAFGNFSYALALGLLLSSLVSWGFDTELMHRGSTDSRQLNLALAEALVLRTIHALPVVLIGGAIGALTRPDRATAFALVFVVLATILDAYGDSGRAATTASEQPYTSAMALVTQRIAACLLALVAIAAGGSLLAVSAAYFASSLLGQLVLIAVLRRLGIRPSFRQVRSENLRRMWRSSLFMGIDIVLAMVLFRVDALMLEALVGAQELARYAVPFRLMETVLFVTWAVSRSFFPSMVRAEPGRPLLGLGEKSLAAAAALLVPYATLLLVEGAGILTLLFGREYGGSSVPALQLLAFAPITFALSYYTAYLLFAQRKAKQMLLATAFGAVANVLLNLLLIPLYGARGAAVVTTVSYAIEGIISIAFLVPANGILRLDKALALSLGAAAPMAAFLIWAHLPLLPEVAIGGLVYLATYLSLARWRDPEQLRLLRSLLRSG